MQTAGENSTKTPLSNAEKVALFHSLFHGRDDVFPRRWENSKTNKVGYAPACHNEWVRGICEKPRIKCGNCPNQAFVPVNDEIVRSHLQGRNIANPERAEPFVAGVYPLLTDETCWFLAADFDKQCWQRDALAFLATCRERSVPAALERSRSAADQHDRQVVARMTLAVGNTRTIQNRHVIEQRAITVGQCSEFRYISREQLDVIAVDLGHVGDQLRNIVVMG